MPHFRKSEAGASGPSTLWVGWFARYARHYIARHFHSLRVRLGSDLRVPVDRPLVLYLNHASWWDPLTMLMLTQRFWPERQFAAPMDAAALNRYRFLAKVGLFGVEHGTLRGARQFLQASLATLARPGGALCVTPQGRFVDVRERPIRFEPGLGQIARRLPAATFVPVAIEYSFWEERSPEILVSCGAPIEVEEHARMKSSDWTVLLEKRLEHTLTELAETAQRRDPSAFETLVGGRSGVGGVYDLWRRMRAHWLGERFTPKHSRL